MRKLLIGILLVFSSSLFAQTCTAVFIGDSITANWNLATSSPPV